MKTIVFGLGIFLSVAAQGLACQGQREVVSSPNEKNQVTFCLNQNGEPSYSVAVEGAEVLLPSRLGFVFQNQKELSQGFSLQTVERQEFDQTWEQVWGEERFIRNHYREMKLGLAQGSRMLFVIFRVFNDGVGFRYEIPSQEEFREVAITRELTEFRFPQSFSAWWIDAMADADYEQHYRKKQLSEVSTAFTPLTVEANGLFVSLHEANLTNYSGMFLEGKGGGLLSTGLYPGPDGVAVHAKLPLQTPWRTIQIGKRPGDLITSYLILNLNEPNRLPDVSWIKPSKFMGIWWGMHIGKFSWGSGPDHGATTSNAKEYILNAQALGIPGLLIEGWNQGWDGDWQANGNVFSFTKPYADFDLPAVAQFAAEHGVELVGHHETSAAVENYEKQVDDAFSLYEQLGIHKVKTGYVGRRMDGIYWRHGQRMVLHHQEIAEKAARHHIMLDIHEPIKDTGLRRTYPNIMTREGACGGEYDAWGGLYSHNPPEHAAIIPFTRGLSGPFDYTPGIFDLARGRTVNDRIRTTLAKQLALYVVIYSPLHMAADLPERYQGHPAFQFIRDVPTDWETTQVLNGEIGGYITTVRKDRNSGDWYLGSVTNEQARDFVLELSFLEPGQNYTAEIYADGPGADYLVNGGSYEIRTITVMQHDLLPVHLAPGGGQAIRFRLSALPPRVEPQEVSPQQ